MKKLLYCYPLLLLCGSYLAPQSVLADEIRTCTGSIDASLNTEPYGSIPRQISLKASYKFVFNTQGTSHGSNKHIYNVDTGYITARFENGDVLYNSIDDITVIDRQEFQGFLDEIIFATSPIRSNSRVGGILQRDRVLSMKFVDSDGGAIHDLELPSDAAVFTGFNGPHSQLLWSDTNNATEALLDIDSISMSCSTAPITSPVTNCINRPDQVHNVVEYGASPTDGNEDTVFFKKAFSCANPGDTIYIPRGIYHLTDTVELKRNGTTAQPQNGVTVKGEGIASQVIQNTAGIDLFRFSEVQGLVVEKLFLGAHDPLAGESGNPALMDIHRVNYSRFDSIFMQGGHTGINIDGSISNSFYDIRSAYNIAEPIPWCRENNDPNPARLNCLTKQWINIVDNKDGGDTRAANANRFYNLILEGGQNGIKYKGTSGNGSFSIFGGVISVIGDHIYSTDVHDNFDPNDPHKVGLALDIETNGHPIKIHDVHIEGSDVQLRGSNTVTFDTVLLVPGEKYGGGHLRIENYAPCDNPPEELCYYASRSTVITNTALDRITIGEYTSLTTLINVRVGFKGPDCPTAPACPICTVEHPCIVDEALNNDLLIDEAAVEQDYHKNQSDTFYLNVNQGGHGKSRSSMGFGQQNPLLNSGTDRILIRGGQKSLPMRPITP